MMARTGASTSNWRGGRTVTEHGYVLVRRPGHPDADCRGYVYEHRLVISEALGRQLADGEEVHHLNGDRADNRIDNLEVCGSRAAHRLHHRKAGSVRRLPGEANPEVGCACGCGRTFARYDGDGRPRRYVVGHGRRARSRVREFPA